MEKRQGLQNCITGLNDDIGVLSKAILQLIEAEKNLNKKINMVCLALGFLYFILVARIFI